MKRKYFITDYGVEENSKELQDEKIQKVLDMCKEKGGIVIIPPGTFKIASLRIWSDTTLYLMNGARLEGSENCNDYKVYELPENFELFTDQQAFHRPETYIPYKNYRRAMIHAYGEENISIIGEGNSVIDGMDCFDPDGEEHFRGPHGIFMSGCKNILLKGYTIQHSGNFMHQVDNCENVTMVKVNAIGGHDGIHLHKGRHFVVKDCLFRTGDDCLAGLDVQDIKVSGCRFNTSCNVFRMGGRDILIENCVTEGPGYYPHLMSVVKNCSKDYKRTDGRHFTICFFAYFSSDKENMFNPVPAHNIVIRNCEIKDVHKLFLYMHGNRQEHCVGTELSEITFENVNVSGLETPCTLHGNKEKPFTATFKNVNVSFAEGKEEKFYDAEYVNIIEE